MSVAALALGCVCQPTLRATDRPAPDYVSGDQADQTEGRKALEDFRATGIAGEYWMEFSLRVMPRKGAERTLHGQIFGVRGERGPLTRLSLGKPGSTESWLIQSGLQSESWHLAPGATAAPLRQSIGETLRPLAGTDLTLFDLQMPFLYWEEYAYEGVAKVRERPTYRFLLYPPAEVSTAQPGLGAVRVALDTQFHALVQAEFLDPKGAVIKSISVLDLKKTGEQWIVKSIDVRNRVTKDKTRFEVTAAALGLALPAEIFMPEQLGAPANLPAGTNIERF